MRHLMARVRCVVVVLCTVLFSGGSLLAMPANDDRANAQVLAGANGSTSGTSVDATDEADEPGGSGSNGVWYLWTAPAGGSVTFDTLGSSYDTTLTAYNTSFGILDDNDDTTGLLSEVTWSAVAGTEYYLRVAGYQGATGTVSLQWSQQGGSVSGDDFADAIQISGVSGTRNGSTSGATDEAWETGLFSAPGEGQASVWFRWTPPSAGTVSVNTFGSSYDTTLAVVTGTTANPVIVGINDDALDGLQSEVIWQAERNTEYRIRVAGYDGASGSYSLNWNIDSACQPPNALAGPVPESGATDVGESVRLEWDQLAAARREVIYGDDDRLDVYQVSDADVLEAAAAVCVLVRPGLWQRNANGTYTLDSTTLGTQLDLCTSEPFRDQPAPGDCSGFLVAPDVIATAGHCTDSRTCDNTAFVFGFRMLSASNARLTAPAADVYFCDEIIGHELANGVDYSLVRLDRPVTGRQPVGVRSAGVVPNGASLVLIGHPSGLPLKIAGGANVRSNSASSHFTANLDAFGGSSGSPVFNASTLNVEGILVRGETDYVAQGNCMVSFQCSDSGCSGEACTKAPLFADQIPESGPNQVFELWFGACGENLQLIAETAERFLDVDDLEAGTEYCWQVLARNACDDTASSVWSFMTESEVLPPPNDDRANSILVTGASGSTQGNSTAATDENNEPAGLGSNSVWWRWIAPGAGTVTFTTLGSDYDTTLGIYSTSLVDLGQNDDFDGGLQSSVTFEAFAGQTYFVRVAGFDGATGSVSLDWLLEIPDPAVLFARADVNLDGGIDLSDPVSILLFLFSGNTLGTECLKAADIDDSGEVDLSDSVLLLRYLFGGGRSPSAPFPACGEDPTEDNLPCEDFELCN